MISISRRRAAVAATMAAAFCGVVVIIPPAPPPSPASPTSGEVKIDDVCQGIDSLVLVSDFAPTPVYGHRPCPRENKPDTLRSAGVENTTSHLRGWMKCHGLFLAAIDVLLEAMVRCHNL